MKTAHTKIDVAKGALTMEFGGDTINFKVSESIENPNDVRSCFAIGTIKNIGQERSTPIKKDALGLSIPLFLRYRLVCRRDGTERNGTGRDGTERSGSKDALEWKQGGRRRRQRGYNFVFHGCGTSRSRGVRWNKNSSKTRSVEQLVPPVLDAPNVGRNALSHSVPSRPTYEARLEV
ncbi:S ribonuclease [Pyrus ussuriensis x Pyrus communis]|uniref:S ribonuclease n=1 Tax=Pyrus ussuriensis x Pyrus communis TaxID=2448454 RepID=A0A5N5GIU9_9ROSA|nr:S ribonuclease [Pyrus ussuriensis x Pyrus communis]